MTSNTSKMLIAAIAGIIVASTLVVALPVPARADPPRNNGGDTDQTNSGANGGIGGPGGAGGVGGNGGSFNEVEHAGGHNSIGNGGSANGGDGGDANGGNQQNCNKAGCHQR